MTRQDLGLEMDIRKVPQNFAYGDVGRNVQSLCSEAAFPTTKKDCAISGRMRQSRRDGKPIKN